MCLPQQQDLILPRGRDADQVPRKVVGKIFKASPMLRPRPTTKLPFATLPSIAESEQPIVIPDDDDTQMTGGSAGSGSSGAAGSTAKTTAEVPPTKRRPMLKPAPSSRPRAVLKSAPSTPRVPPLVASTLCLLVPLCHRCSQLRVFRWFSPACRHLLRLHRQPRWLPRHHVTRRCQNLCHQQHHQQCPWVHLRLQRAGQRLSPLGSRSKLRSTSSLEMRSRSTRSAQRRKGRCTMPCWPPSSRLCMRTL